MMFQILLFKWCSDRARDLDLRLCVPLNRARAVMDAFFSDFCQRDMHLYMRVFLCT